jgi:hypothetical protein
VSAARSTASNSSRTRCAGPKRLTISASCPDNDGDGSVGSPRRCGGTVASGGNPRYGLLGTVSVPYFLVFELLGPVFQLLGYPVVIVAFATSAVSLAFLLAFLVMALLLGVLLSVSALALEEFSFRRYARGREAARLLLFAVLENFGYRQLNDFWRLQAFADFARRRRSWGDMHRRGLGTAPSAPRG